MSAPVEIIAQRPQPTSGSTSLPPGASRQLITLVGKLGAVTPHQSKGVVEEHTVNALVGSEGVLPTAGWGKWAKVERRQRVGLTVLEGYEPYTLSVPLLFDARFLGLQDVEHSISVIEWMGGRGSLFRGKPGHPALGESPRIEVYSASELVPKWCQSGGGREGEIYYVLDNPIEYNSLGREWVTPIRRSASEPNPGRRIRQALTISLLQYLPPSGVTNSAQASKILRKQEHSYLTFVVNRGVNTFTKIAKHYNRSDPGRISTAAREIQRANKHYGASVTKALPRNAKIKVPESATARRF